MGKNNEFSALSVDSQSDIDVRLAEFRGKYKWVDAMCALSGDAATYEALRCAAPVLKCVDVEKLLRTTPDDIIDKFLDGGDYKIVVEEESTSGDEEVTTAAEFDPADDLVSEELAQIYLQQGLLDQAKETYIKLSLRNPEKSVYFAELIAKINN